MDDQHGGVDAARLDSAGFLDRELGERACSGGGARVAECARLAAADPGSAAVDRDHARIRGASPERRLCLAGLGHPRRLRADKRVVDGGRRRARPDADQQHGDAVPRDRRRRPLLPRSDQATRAKVEGNGGAEQHSGRLVSGDRWARARRARAGDAGRKRADDGRLATQRLPLDDRVGVRLVVTDRSDAVRDLAGVELGYAGFPLVGEGPAGSVRLEQPQEREGDREAALERQGPPVRRRGQQGEPRLG